MRLLFLGRLDPKKGIENLLDALPLLENDAVSLKIAGTGPPSYTNYLQRRVGLVGLVEAGIVRRSSERGGKDKGLLRV